MASIHEHFEKDFPYVIGAESILSIERKNTRYEINIHSHLDFDAHAFFASFYLPEMRSEDIESAVETLIINSESLLQLKDVTNITLPRLHSLRAGTIVSVAAHVDHTQLIHKSVDGLSVENRNLIFTRRLYFYSEHEIPFDIQNHLNNTAAANGFIISFRGPAYAKEVDKKLKPKAFISHDSRDKMEIARPIALGLQQLNVPVWYDEFSLRVGDSLRESIEKGLRTTRFCILILTPNFLSKGGWPKREYDIAFTREILENIKFFLPVWHNVTKEEVFEYSPILADRYAVHWSLGIEEVCKKLYEAIELPDRSL